MARVAAILVLPALLAWGLFAAAERLVGSEPADPVPWTTWGDRSHSSRAELAAWLKARGASYEVWAKRHPGAAARLEGRVAPPPPRPEPTATGPTTAAVDRARSVPRPVLAALAAAAGLALAAVAIRRRLPTPRLPLRRPVARDAHTGADATLLARYRVELALWTTGAALSVGLGVLLGILG